MLLSSVPTTIATWLDGWGPRLREAVLQARAVTLPNEVDAGLPERPIRVSTDCSGAEAPIWALQSCAVSCHHVSSCEIDPAPRALIEANCATAGPGFRMFSDILQRNATDVPAHDLYVAGFPCTPFSSLHHGAKPMQDKNTRQFRACVRTIASCRPAVAVLENVVGILKVLPQVMRTLRQAGPYHIWGPVRMDPHTDFLEPIRRPRVYFVLIRHDRAIGSKPTEFLETLWSDVPKRCRPEQAVRLAERLLPSSHASIASFKKRLMSCSRGVSRPAAKWHEVHKTFRDLHALHTSPTTSPSCWLSSDRERDAWQVFQALHPGQVPLVADVSQRLDRASCRTDGTLPTITPNSRIMMRWQDGEGTVERSLAPIEKMLLHGLPVHRLRAPQRLSERAVEKMGGNTMHVQCVAAAMLLGIVACRWDFVQVGAPSLEPRSPHHHSPNGRAFGHGRGGRRVSRGGGGRAPAPGETASATSDKARSAVQKRAAVLGITGIVKRPATCQPPRAAPSELPERLGRPIPLEDLFGE